MRLVSLKCDEKGREGQGEGREGWGGGEGRGGGHGKREHRRIWKRKSKMRRRSKKAEKNRNSIATKDWFTSWGKTSVALCCITSHWAAEVYRDVNLKTCTQCAAVRCNTLFNKNSLLFLQSTAFLLCNTVKLLASICEPGLINGTSFFNAGLNWGAHQHWIKYQIWPKRIVF